MLCRFSESIAAQNTYFNRHVTAVVSLGQKCNAAWGPSLRDVCPVHLVSEVQFH